jgi:hypothetical protein
VFAGASHASNCNPYADPVYQGNANKGAQASICNPYADPVYQGNANKGGGEGKGETKATPDADYSKSLLNPETVTPATPAATETVVSTDQRTMNYGSINNAVDSLGVGNEIVSK